MVSREHKRAALHEKLQLLRSITNSHALNRASIIVDASKYIEELKKKVEKLNQEIVQTSTEHEQNPFPTVTVETLEKGFLVNVYSGNSCPGLLVSLLEAFEEMDLNVLEAKDMEEQGRMIDARGVKQAVVQAIRKWRETTEQE